MFCELVKTEWKAFSPACGLADDLHGDSLDKMDQFPRDFDLRVKNDGMCIGRGHFSIVLELETREVVAVKELKLVNRDVLIRELYILYAYIRLKPSFLLKFIPVCGWRNYGSRIECRGCAPVLQFRVKGKENQQRDIDTLKGAL